MMGLEAASCCFVIPAVILPIISLNTPGAAWLSRPMAFISASGGAAVGTIPK